jgi:hypothetical protein
VTQLEVPGAAELPALATDGAGHARHAGLAAAPRRAWPGVDSDVHRLVEPRAAARRGRERQPAQQPTQRADRDRGDRRGGTTDAA